MCVIEELGTHVCVLVVGKKKVTIDCTNKGLTTNIEP